MAVARALVRVGVPLGIILSPFSAGWAAEPAFQACLPHAQPASIRRQMARDAADRPPGAHRFRAEDGFFAGLAAIWNDVGGDFTGNLVLIDPYQIVFLPDLGWSKGMGLILGGRSAHSEGELSYSITRSDSRWRGDMRRARYYSLSGASRLFFLPGSRVQPFIQAGGGVVKLVVEDGSRPTDTVDFQISDSRLWDFESHGGFGLAWFLDARVSLRLTAVYRLVAFGADRIEGVAGTIYPERDIRAPTLSVSLGIARVF